MVAARVCLYHALIAWILVDSSREENHQDAQLRYFETINLSEIRTRHLSKRETERSGGSREVSFRALGRNFQLILSPSQGLLSAQFKAYSVDRTGARSQVWVDDSQFFDGKLVGESESKVSAHIEEGILTASIRLPEDVYIVEPSWRHAEALHYRGPSAAGGEDAELRNSSNMIVYRASDVMYSWDQENEKGDMNKFCGAIRENATANAGKMFEKRETIRDAVDTEPVVGEPLRQYEPTQTRCSLLLVADHKFYENMGGKSHKGTINFIISLIDRVNKIFLDTEWKDNERQQGFRGMGFVIQEVHVHTEPTPVSKGQEHYNMPNKNWNVRELLEVFSRTENHRWFCLAHLFTDQKFEGGILGLAYVGSPRKNSVGGICSPGYVKNGHTLYLNSGLSTSRNHYGHRVITREADLVTAHEFGHNWGSEHDPDLPECSPDSQKGGSYLMYTYSVSGYDGNNKRFSPCSVRSIRAVLLAKAGKCFSKPEESFCGNLLVERDEECDAGLGASSEASDPCCTAQCKLKHGAKCSDRNTPCCKDCQYMEQGILCREAMPNACKGEAYCSGESAECPPPKPTEDNSSCLDRGKCRAGDCLPYCETLGLISCMCDNEVDACKRCCRQHLNSTCHPVEPVEILLDGTPCIHGFCEEGSCKKTVQDIVERFWDIIEDIDINTVLKFSHDNIVSLVLLLVTVLWIPFSCLITFTDRKKHRQMREYAKSREPISEKKLPFSLPDDSAIKIIKIPKNVRVIAALPARPVGSANNGSMMIPSTDRRSSGSNSSSLSIAPVNHLHGQNTVRQWANAPMAVRTSTNGTQSSNQRPSGQGIDGASASSQCCIPEGSMQSSTPQYMTQKMATYQTVMKTEIPQYPVYPLASPQQMLMERDRRASQQLSRYVPPHPQQDQRLMAAPQYEMHNMQIFPYPQQDTGIPSAALAQGYHPGARFQIMMGNSDMDYGTVVYGQRAQPHRNGQHGQPHDRSGDYL